MSELRYLTAGESHGRALTTILEGMPAGVPVTEEDINLELARRQKGYGRGARMAIETDKAQVSSGIRSGETIGSPISMTIFNKDWEKWQKLLSVDPKDRDESKRVIKPRPGHADLVGMLKYDRKDAQDILDRASARETAARVAVGAVCRKLLGAFGIEIQSFVREIGSVRATKFPTDFKELVTLTEASAVRCPDAAAEKAMIELIDKSKTAGDTCGGVYSVIIKGCPVGLGSHVHWDRKLEARLCWAMMSIQAMKGVEMGMGFDMARKPGSQVHDELFYDKKKGFYRNTNNAGGFEGGMTTGEPIVISVAMKPISTLMKPLQSVNVETKEPFKAEVIRSDVTAVPAAGVAAEAIAAYEIALAMREKFGGDSLREMKDNYQRYVEHVRSQMNIVLTGFMGTGKSAVGRHLATELRVPFIDMDAVIAKKARQSMSELFATKGEEAFRALESEVAVELSREDKTVIATGGGVLMDPKNREHLQKNGILICLTAKMGTLLERLKEDLTRPLLSGENLEQKVDRLMKERQSVYALCPIQVDTEGKSIAQVAAEIIKKVSPQWQA